KLCHQLDVMFPRCSTEQTAEIKEAFELEKLIPTFNGEWARADEVFWGSDDLRVPGATAIHAELRHFAIWQRIGVPERPTVEMVLAWLNSLPKFERLAAEDLRRIDEVLPRYPQRIWTECGCWLNLAQEWSPVGELVYYS